MHKEHTSMKEEQRDYDRLLWEDTFKLLELARLEVN